MSISFRTKRRSMDGCPHRSVMTMEVAGMRRQVCDSCGRVSIANIVKHHPLDRLQESESPVVRLADSTAV